MSFMSFYGSSDLRTNLEKDLDNLMSKVIDWRHDIHQYPELGNREFRTAKKQYLLLDIFGCVSTL